jgi:hypothetical protein
MIPKSQFANTFQMIKIQFNKSNWESPELLRGCLPACAVHALLTGNCDRVYKNKY